MTISIEHEAQSIEGLEEDEIVHQVIEAAVTFENCPYEIEVNVLFTDSQGIHAMNKEFRGIDAPTDVLSFPMVDYDCPGDFTIAEDNVEEYFNPESGELVLGDIVLNVDRIQSQAQEYGHSTKRELGFLTAHSMLHLFGYDHMEPEEAQCMESRQEAILQTLNITR